MDTYRFKSILCAHCNQKNLVEVTSNLICPSCGNELLKTIKKSRARSQKKAKKDRNFEKEFKIARKKFKEEEKKSVKPKKNVEKKIQVIKKKNFKDSEHISGIKPKAQSHIKKKEPKSIKQPKRKLHKAVPSNRYQSLEFREMPSNLSILSDSSESDLLNIAFDRVNRSRLQDGNYNHSDFPPQSSLYEELFDNYTFHRISHNLFNLFFSNFPGVRNNQFSIFTSIYRPDVQSIADILNQFVNIHPNTATPATPVAISRIPFVKITESQLLNNPSCAICQENFTNGEMLKQLICEHYYHDDCITPWLRVKNNCPVCREIIN